MIIIIIIIVIVIVIVWLLLFCVLSGCFIVRCARISLSLLHLAMVGIPGHHLLTFFLLIIPLVSPFVFFIYFIIFVFVFVSVLSLLSL